MGQFRQLQSATPVALEKMEAIAQPIVGALEIFGLISPRMNPSRVAMETQDDLTH